MQSLSKQSQNLQDQILQHLADEGRLVDIYLTNGIRLQGYINGSDTYAIFLSKTPAAAEIIPSQMIYKHAVSTISYAVKK